MKIYTLIVFGVVFTLLGYKGGRDVAQAEDVNACQAYVYKVEKIMEQQCQEWCDERAVFDHGVMEAQK